jgi:hypothetical protein
MRDDLDAQDVGCHAVVERAGKAAEDEGSKIWIGGCADLRMGEQEIRRATDFSFEPLAQSRDLSFVKIGCLDEFQFRLRWNSRFIASGGNAGSRKRVRQGLA